MASSPAGSAGTALGDYLAVVSSMWGEYYAKDEVVFTPSDGRVMVVRNLADFLLGAGRSLVPPTEVLRNSVIGFNYEDLVAACPMEDFGDALRDEPTDLLACLGLALCVLRVRYSSVAVRPPKMVARIFSVSPLTPIRSLKAHCIGKLVSVRGNVVRVSPVRPLVQEMAFSCLKCGTDVDTAFQDGKYEPPTRCRSSIEGKPCKGTKFVPDRSSARAVDWQKVKLQEADDDDPDPGRIPRTVECELSADMVDACVPGDVVTVAGVVKHVNVEVAAGKGTAKARSLFVLYIDVLSVATAKLSDGAEVDAKQQIANDRNVFGRIVASVCPAIFGHETVKAGLALTLFGGTQPPSGSDRAGLAIRPDPHMLIVGDPGLGKSQMLRATCLLAPRSVYVGGNTTSTTGLTVTMVRDSTGDFALEAGALVLGDRGVCCIDEFDKMENEHQALLEAMEQQRISIAKAGIVCSLSARTSIIAAANPVGGHYDRGKTVQENLKMSQALLSRFDLLFILLDRPDDDKDRELSRHVMALHSTRSARVEASGVSSASQSSLSSRFGRLTGHTAGVHAGDTGASAGAGDADSFKSRLVAAVAECRGRDDTPFGGGRCSSHGGGAGASGPVADGGVLAAAQLKKYVAYARRYVQPRLTPEAALVLQKFYLGLRRSHSSEESTPITTRQLESLIRLAQARAKVELRETVEPEDAADVVELMKESLFDVCTDEYGVVDYARTSGMSMSKQVKTFVAAMNREAERRASSLFSLSDLRDVAARLGLNLPSLGDFIEVLNQQSYLLKKGAQMYQLTTSLYSQAVSRR